jgi:hypothetical protein
MGSVMTMTTTWAQRFDEELKMDVDPLFGSRIVATRELPEDC